MTDLASLRIRVQSLEVATAERRLKDMANQGGKAERATDGVTGAFGRLVGPAAVVAGTLAGMTKLVGVSRQFDVLNAQLITATGGAQNAGIAFEAIQDFAQNTPYDLGQVTDSFTKLVNLGLTPSESALTSYGNTASAMGKDLNQLIEAVADAATGEFERLKEFGIKTKSEGDKVSFTFRGVTTTVGKNAAEIESYLQALGENEFAGAMQQRMDTLDGALSNLADEWDKTWLSISSLGIGSTIEESVRVAIDVLAELNAMLASGQIEGYLDAIAGKFDGVGRDIATTLDLITELWNEVFSTTEGQGLAGATSETVKFIVQAFKNLPENIRSVIQLMAVEIAALVDYGMAYGAAFGEVLGAEFAKLVEKSKAYGTAIAEGLNPFSDSTFDLEGELRRLDIIAAETADNAFGRAKQQASVAREARRESILAIMEERDAALNSFDVQITAADKLRAKYDEELAARRANTEDRLARFSQAGEGDGGPTKNEAKALESLRKALRTEEEVIQESYDKRLALILKNTEEGSAKQAELKRRLDEEFAASALGDLATPDSYQSQLSALEEFYANRRELILNNSALTEEARTELEAELTQQRNERLNSLEQERLSAIFQSSSELFGELSGLAKTFAGEQSTVYKGLFAVSKAFAIADSIIKIQQGIANAASLPYPGNLAAIGSVVSATGGIVSTISGTSFSGAYDNGGIIPQGSVGLVGEFGPELVSGPANVRSRRETAEMLNSPQKQDTPAPAPVFSPKIVNVLDQSVLAEYMSSADGQEVILNTIRENPDVIKSVGAA